MRYSETESSWPPLTGNSQIEEVHLLDTGSAHKVRNETDLYPAQKKRRHPPLHEESKKEAEGEEEEEEQPQQPEEEAGEGEEGERPHPPDSGRVATTQRLQQPEHRRPVPPDLFSQHGPEARGGGGGGETRWLKGTNMSVICSVYYF